FLPDTSFPADRVESVQEDSKDFSLFPPQIQNMTSTVNLLESYDKRNLELIRRSFAELQEKLEEYIGETGILSISKPKVVQINGDLSSSYVYGCWGKDSKPDPGYESMYFYGGSSSTIYGRYYQLYSDYEKLILRSYFKRYSLGNDKGNNYIVHGNAMYYQAYSPLRMGKVNLTSLQLEYRVITEASERFSYSFINDQFLDFAADEKGLWVIYASEQSNGKLIVGKINENFLDIEERHTTSVYKVHATNAFMACGVLYVTRSVDLTTDEIFYAYDTQTSEEKYLNVPFQKFRDQYSYLDYNPTDQKLYMYNSGYYVSYDVRFNKE
uniref:Olfactomedin-like domain-containing protein n=1 Tax=Salarias fasciatus TaxID=181472 RepID=A0A672G263_SALFA